MINVRTFGRRSGFWQMSTLLAVVVVSVAAVGVAEPVTGVSGSTPDVLKSVAAPVYDGVEQVLVLTDRWVIVATSTLPEVIEGIDALSHGQFKRAVDSWDQSNAAGEQDWGARQVINSLRDQYIAQARENAGERELGLPESYQIASKGDDRYAAPRHPVQVGYTLVGTGARRITGAPEVEYLHYAYLALPEPMESGRTYTITVGDKKRVTYLYDVDQTVSRAIKLNQAGYLDSAPKKFAYLGAHLYDIGPLDCSMYTQFDVVRVDSGSVAFSGSLELRDRNSRIVAEKNLEHTAGIPPLITGEDVYEMDFTGLQETGEFYIRIPGVGRSWAFHHGPDSYGPVFYTAARGLYHQRCGIAYEAPYTAWKRVKCHTAPVYECDYVAFGLGAFDAPEGYDRFDVIGATTDRSVSHEDTAGGWHDAADWDRYNAHYTVVFDLLYAYEIAPEKYTDGQLNIPESGNGIPDLLDEAAYGLQVWAKSMNADGGVSGAVETWTHPRIDGDVAYAYARRTRWDSLLFAAAAAQLAEHLGPMAPEESADWAARAKKAYAYGQDPANSLGKVTFAARTKRGQGAPYTLTWEEKEAYILPFLLHARVRLYRLTGEENYLEGLSRDLQGTPPPYASPYSMKDYSPWLYFGMMHGEKSFLPAFQRKKLIQSLFLAPADRLINELNGMPYRSTWPRNQDYWMGWGASDLTNAGRMLLIAHTLSGDPKYRAAAILNFDFMLGANPMGMSWTTGIGYTYPVNIQHEVSIDDGIADPVPGITIYGVTGGMYGALKDSVWRSPGGSLSTEPVVFDVPEVPLWRRWSCHPSLNVAQCEFTIQETMSSTIFCSALLMPEGWMPSEALKGHQPRPPGSLYGYWYLP